MPVASLRHPHAQNELDFTIDFVIAFTQSDHFSKYLA